MTNLHILNTGRTQTIYLARGSRIRVKHGVIWVTIAGDPADYLLAANATLVVAHAGQVVISAMIACEMMVEREAGWLVCASDWLRSIKIRWQHIAPLQWLVSHQKRLRH